MAVWVHARDESDTLVSLNTDFIRGFWPSARDGYTYIEISDGYGMVIDIAYSDLVALVSAKPYEPETRKENL